MWKPALAITIIMLVACGLLRVQFVHASTSESGSISSDITWTVSGSPYTLSGDLVIASGAALTIQPGVTVNFGINKIQVNGVLNAQGSINNGIKFSGIDAGLIFSSASASTISNTDIDSIFLTIQQGSVTLNSDYFSGMVIDPVITVNGGNAVISNSVIYLVEDGIDVFSGSAQISNNFINGIGRSYGIYTGAATSTTITENNITDCFTGIWAEGSSDIEHNIVFANANDGVCSPNSIIKFNVIANNSCGVSGGGTVEYNTITGNSAGIWSPVANGVIAHNNIYDNFNITWDHTQNIHLTDFNNANAVMNWWGSTDPTMVGQTIWDYKNDPAHLGTVTFEPMLNSPEQSAPSIPNSVTAPTRPVTTTSTPTATPTLSSSAASNSKWPTPYFSPTTSSNQSYLPRTITSGPIVGSTENSDLYSIFAIVGGFIAAVAIIFALNIKFRKGKEGRPSKIRRSRGRK